MIYLLASFLLYEKFNGCLPWTDERRPGINTFSSMETLTIAIVMQNGEKPGTDWIARIGEGLRRRPHKITVERIS